jgi:putative transposase
VRPRKHPRLRGFDYASEGLYFVTFCTQYRRCILGQVEDEAVRLSDPGLIVWSQIEQLPIRLGVHVDAFVVMPNHVHVILGLRGRARQASPLRLGAVVGALKAGSSRLARQSLWQRGYHDHIVRDEQDLERLRTYIASNPARWQLDPEHPSRPGSSAPSPASPTSLMSGDRGSICRGHGG